MSRVTRIATVDDHPIILEGLHRVLKRMKNTEIVGQGVCADDAVRIANDLRPDIIILDITLPGGGIEAARTILKSDLGVEIILLTASDDEETLATAIDSGVKGYLVKGGGIEELQQAIAAVGNGQAYVSGEMALRFISQRNLRRKPATPARALELSDQEQTLLSLLAEGLSNKQIAERLNIALPTTKNMLSSIFQKMGVRSRVQALLAWQAMSRN